MKPSTQIIAPLLAQVMRTDTAFCTVLVVDKYNRLVAAAGSAVDRQALLKALNAQSLQASERAHQAGDIYYRIQTVSKSVFLVTASRSDNARFEQQTQQLQQAIIGRLRRYLLQRARQPDAP